MRLKVMLPLIVLALVAMPATASAKQARGFNISPRWYQLSASDVDGELAQAQAIGSEVVRAPVPLGFFEPKPGQYDAAFASQLNQLFTLAAQHNQKLLIVLGGTPCWESTKPVTGDPCAAGWDKTDIATYTAQKPEVFAAAAGFIVAHWHTQLAAIEIWNEPNSKTFFAGTAADYVAIVARAYKAVKAIAPDVPVLGGALGFSDTDYLKQMYAAGFAGNSDGLSIHPYDVRFSGARAGFGDPTLPALSGEEMYSFFTGIPRIRQVMVDNGESNNGLWLTEVGYASCPASPYCVTEATQGYRVYQAFFQAWTYPYVKSVLDFDLRDPVSPTAGWQDHFGVLNGNFTAKGSLSYVKSTFSFLAQKDAAATTSSSRRHTIPKHMPRAFRSALRRTRAEIRAKHGRLVKLRKLRWHRVSRAARHAWTYDGWPGVRRPGQVSRFQVH